jgi:hypothetical protein
LFLGSKKFVARLRKRNLPENHDRAIARHRYSAVSLDLVAIVNKTVRLPGCDVKEFKKNSRVSGNLEITLGV